MAKAAIGITRTEVEVQGRLPSPPRTPSFDPGQPGAVSGTRRIPVPPAPRDGEFPAEEPSSFDTRRTPVVPAKWPAHDDEERPTQPAPSEPLLPMATPLTATPETPETPSSSAPDARAHVATPEPRQDVLQSLGPPASGEPDFFDKPPLYSIEPPLLVSDPPRVRPSLLRSMLSKFLFVTIVCAVVMLLSYELSVANDLPTLDPRRLLDWARGA